MNAPNGSLQGYAKRAAHEWRMWRHRARTRRNQRLFAAWIEDLCDCPPDVLLGANSAMFGGVRHHMHAICRFSTLDVRLVPGERLLDRIGSPLSLDLKERFKAFRAGSIRVVHSHVYPWFIDWCGERQREGAGWVHTYHLSYYRDHAIGELEPWQEEINDALHNVACHADVRISVSRWQAAELAEKHGISTIYIPNGVDVSICSKGNSRRFARKLGLADFVLYVGRNDPVKNPGDFVRVAQRLPRHQFVMVGWGLDEESLRSEWNVEVPGNLRVLGPLSHAEVQDAIAACSSLVVTSKREGLPTLAMEAMAQGKVVVVPTDEGCLEVIDEGRAGLFYEQGDLDDLAEKVLEAARRPELELAARERVLAEYDWRVVAPKLDAVYEQLAS